MLGAATYLTSILGLLALFAFASYIWLPDTGLASDVTRIVQASVTAVAIAAGGVFAGVKLQVFRDFEPHLDVKHEISHRYIGGSYVHIGVTSILRNGSKVKIEILEGIFALQRIEPISDDMIEGLYAQTSNQEMQWPVLEKVERRWGKNDLVIEPGESHRETYEFVISRETTSVLVYTYFHNSKYSPESQRAEGWAATSFYDIVNPSST